MKQGSGNSSMGSTKREPIAYPISPAAAGQIGVIQGSNPAMVNTTRGVQAPAPAACTSHQCGSQGKHK